MRVLHLVGGVGDLFEFGESSLAFSGGEDCFSRSNQPDHKRCDSVGLQHGRAVDLNLLQLAIVSENDYGHEGASLQP